MNNYVFFIDFPIMQNNFFFIAEDTVMKPPPIKAEELDMNSVSYVYRKGEEVKVKAKSYPALQFELNDVKRFKDNVYENCKLETENLFFHCHNLFEIDMILSGNGYYFVDGKAIEVSAGSIIIFNKLVPHAWAAAKGEPPVQRTFSFYPSLMLAEELAEQRNYYINDYLNDLVEWHGSLTEKKLIWDMLEQIYEEYQRKERGYQVLIKNIIVNLFIYQARERMELSAVKNAKKNKTIWHEVEKAITYIRSNFQNNITLEDAAKQVYMHPNYFSSLFKKKYGVSFAHYMNMLKATMASELMQSTDLSVEEISKQCGFTSISNYYRVFKEYFNMSPAQYLKSMQE